MIKYVFFWLNFIALIGTNNLDLSCIDYDIEINKCHLCAYNYYNMHSNPFLSENEIFDPNFCASKINLQKKAEIFVASGIKCENTCLGTENSPFENLYIAFSYIMGKYNSYNFSSLIIYLMNEESHYFYNNSDQAEYFFLFRRMNINLTITPLFCEYKNIPGCISSETQYSKIVLKSQYLSIFVSNQLNINNIIFNGIDLSLSNWNDDYYESSLNQTICSEDGLANLSNDYVKKNCYLKNRQKSSKPMKYGLFILEPFFDCDECPPANLNIKNCEFRVINSIRNWISLISVYLPFPINITIKNTIFTKCYFNQGIISLASNFDLFYFIPLSRVNKYMDLIKNKNISYIMERNTISYFDYFKLNNETNYMILMNFQNTLNNIYSKTPNLNLNISHDNYLLNVFDQSNETFIFISNFSNQSSLIISNITVKYCKMKFFLIHKCLFNFNLIENSYFISNMNAGFYFLEENTISFQNNTIKDIILQSDFIFISNIKLFMRDCLFENISSFEKNSSSLLRIVSPLLHLLKRIFDEGESKNLTYDEITLKNCSFENFYFTNLLNSSIPLRDIIMEDCSFLAIALLFFEQSLIECYIENLILFKRIKFEKIIGSHVFYSLDSRNRIFEEVLFINSQASFLFIVGSFAIPSFHNMKLSLTQINIENISIINKNNYGAYSLINLYIDFTTDNSDVILRDSFFKNISFSFQSQYNRLICLNNPFYVLIFNVCVEEIHNSNMFYLANYANAPIINITCFFIFNHNVSSFNFGAFFNINFILLQKSIFLCGEKQIQSSSFLVYCYPNCYLVFIDNRISQLKIYLKYQNIKRIIFKNCIFENTEENSNADINLYLMEKVNSLYENKDNKELIFDNYFIYCQNLVALSELSNKSQCLELLKTNILLSIGELEFFNTTEWNYLLFTYGFQDSLFFNGTGVVFELNFDSECVLKNVSFYNYRSFSNIIFKSNGRNNLYCYELNIFNGSSDSYSDGSVFNLVASSYAYVKNAMIHNITSRGKGAIFNIFTSSLELIDVNIENTVCQNGGVIYSLSGKINIINVSIKNSIAQIIGGAIYMKLSHFYLKNAIIDKCLSYFDGGALYIDQNQNFEVKNISIENSFALRSAMIFIKGGEAQNYYFENLSCISNYGKNSVCIYAKEGGIFINISTIYKNTGDHSLISSSSSFSKISIQVNSSSFRSNKVKKYLIFCEKSKSLYKNLSFQNDSFDENLFFFSFSDFHMESIKIILTDENIFKNAEPLYAIFAFSSNGFILNSYFDFSSNLIASIFNDNSFLNISFNKFLNNKGILGGTIKIISLFKSIIDLNFFYNSLAEYGAAIYAFNSLIVIQNNTFIENYAKFQGSDMFLSNIVDEIKIVYNVFHKFYSISSAFINIISLEIYNNSFFGNNSTKLSLNNNFYDFTQAMYLENVLIILIKNSYISNINGLSAFQFINTNPKSIILSMNSTTFVNCSTSLSGGSLSLFGAFNLTILNSMFFNNSALMSGGAIYIDWNSKNFLYHLENNTFENNLAKLYGGALKFPLIDLAQLSYLKNEFISNKASVGNNISTNAAQLYLSLFGFSALSDLQNLSKPFDMNESLKRINISSGQRFELYIVILDSLNNFLIYENYGEVTIEIQKDFDDFYDDKKYENINLLNYKAKVESGLGVFSSLVFIGEPGQTYLANIKYTKSNITINSIIYFDLIYCKVGEIYINSKCISCPIGFYSLEENSFGSDKNSCDLCPSDAFCPGGNFIIPLKGFWRLDELSILMIRCTNPENCPDQIENFLHSKQNYSYCCQLGTYGNLCSNCISGFGKNSNDLCMKCSTETFLYMKFFGFFTFTLMILLYQSIVATKSDENEIKTRSLLKVLINHNYYLTFLGNLKLEWFGNLKEMLIATDTYMTSVSRDIMNFDCFLNKHASQETIPILKLILFSFFPLLMFFSIAFIRIFVISFKRVFKIFYPNFRKDEKKSMIKEIKAVIPICFIVSIYNFYSRITANTLKLLKCINLDQTSRTFLEIDPNIECWVDEGLHYFLLKTLFLLNFVLWCLGWPILILSILRIRKYKARQSITKASTYGKRKKLSSSEKKIQLNFDKKLKNPIQFNISTFLEFEKNKTTRRRFQKNNEKIKSGERKIQNNLLAKHFKTKKKIEDRSLKEIFQKSKIVRFLTSDYRSVFYYWEVILYFFNLMIVILNVTTSHIDSNPQGRIFMLLYILMLLFVEIKKPYKYTIVNDLASFSYLSMVFTIGFILIILTDGQPFVFQQHLYFSIIIIFNGFFYLKWFAIFAKIIFFKHLKHLKIICDIFRKTFRLIKK